jgi:hypothetical protein
MSNIFLILHDIIEFDEEYIDKTIYENKEFIYNKINQIKEYIDKKICEYKEYIKFDEDNEEDIEDYKTENKNEYKTENKNEHKRNCINQCYNCKTRDMYRTLYMAYGNMYCSIKCKEKAVKIIEEKDDDDFYVPLYDCD